MRDRNQPIVAKLSPANHNEESQEAGLKKQISALFLDDWPAPPKCVDEQCLDSVAMADVRKWRLQTILAVSPFGVPSLALAPIYEKMFGRKFDLKDFKCDSLDELIEKMSDIMVVQQPCSTTTILFPDHPYDKVLHDIRLGHDFTQPDYDSDSTTVDTIGSDSNDLIYRAWVDRDEEFPPDVVLVGEPYEQLLKISMANIEGSRGLYQANLVSAASPDSLFIRLKTSDENTKRINGLSAEIDAYLKKSEHPIDSYNVPREFVSPNFPCLLYSKERGWERCVIVGGAANGNKILVESIDFGGVYAVYLIFLYLIPRLFLEIPRQTLAVSITGIKPSGNGEKWSEAVGPRLRCFSINDYWIDVLLIAQKKKRIILQQRDMVAESNKDDTNRLDAKSADLIATQRWSECKRRKRQTVTDRASYDAIFIDRNIPEIDLFIDEILVMETYADEDLDRKKEINNLKAKLKEAFRKIPRPINTLNPSVL